MPVKRLTTQAANYIHWADGGKTITWSFGNDFSRVNRDFDRLEARKSPINGNRKRFRIALGAARIPKGDLFLRGARIDHER